MKAHPLVTAEWPHITEVPAYDFQIATDDVHVGVYVRRVSGHKWHARVGLVNHVVVAPQQRGRGFASDALLTVFAWLIGANVLYAHVHCDPEQSGFYERLGFFRATNFPTPSHHGPRVSMVHEENLRWPTDAVEYVEPW